VTTVKKIRELTFHHGSFLSLKHRINWENNKIHYHQGIFWSKTEGSYQKYIEVTNEQVMELLMVCDSISVRGWQQQEYIDDDILDGFEWGLHIDILLDENGEETQYLAKISGYHLVPDDYGELVKAFERLIHDNLSSNTYDAEILKTFMDDQIKGEEKRKRLFKKVTPMVLEIIEKRINIDILDYDVREILMKYMQQAQYFAQEQEDIDIFNCFIRTYHGENNNNILLLTDYFEDVMIRSFVLRGFDIFGEKV